MFQMMVTMFHRHSITSTLIMSHTPASTVPAIASSSAVLAPAVFGKVIKSLRLIFANGLGKFYHINSYVLQHIRFCCSIAFVCVASSSNFSCT